jgi:biotin-(acetyl-CoA carboxylase) ligase
MKDGIELEHGKLLGLTEAGYLKLKLSNGEEKTIQCGDVKLRQVDRT